MLAGAWADAVEVFRHGPALPDFFTRQPPYAEEYRRHGGYQPPQMLQAVFKATAAPRRVEPALPEVEFLHGWSAYQLREWSAAIDRLEAGPDAGSTEWRIPVTAAYWDRTAPDDSVVRGALDRAAALAPDDPFFVEAARTVSARADLVHADAMRRTFLLFEAGGDPCAGPGCAEPPRRAGAGAADPGVTPWGPWAAPPGTGRPLAEAPDGDGLTRLFADVYRDVRRNAGGPLEDVRAFPLAGRRLDGRTFWAVVDPSADTCRARRLGVSIGYASGCAASVLAVYERRDGGWRAVAQRRVTIDTASAAAPVALEPSNAWIVTRGVQRHGDGVGASRWEVLRFDGESLRVEAAKRWLDAMIADIDGDGALEILGIRARPLCDECSVTHRAVRLHRWNGARLTAAPLELLPAGAASEAGVAANNRAVALARARRWLEAVAVLDTARPLVGGHPVFRRNASLIDLNAGVSAPRLSEDTLLHHVFAGSWAEAVDRFRRAPAGPEWFAETRSYFDGAARTGNEHGMPPFLRAIFDATSAARAVGPARAEIELLHAWSAFHLDRDTTSSPSHWSNARHRVAVEDAALLETLDRAAALAPRDALFTAARQAAAARMAR